jgi:hypothetical protein
VDSDLRWIGAKLPPGLWDDHRAFRAGAIGALTMVYLLDTNVAIHLRDGDATATSRVAALEGAILLSVISRVELEGVSIGTPLKRYSPAAARCDVGGAARARIRRYCCRCVSADRRGGRVF